MSAIPHFDVAVSIVTYNDSAKPITACKRLLETVRHTIIVVFEDNSAGMECVEALREEFEMKTNVSIDRSGTNVGYGAGNNRVLLKADSRYALVMNPDVVVEERAVDALIDILDREEDIVAISPRIIGEDGAQQYLCRKDPTFFGLFIRRFLPKFLRPLFRKRLQRDMYHPETGAYERRMDVDWFTGSFMLIRTNDFMKIGGFDENFYMYLEDADLCRRLRARGRVVYEPSARVTHTWERKSYKQFSHLGMHIRSTIYYLRKWAGKRRDEKRA